MRSIIGPLAALAAICLAPSIAPAQPDAPDTCEEAAVLLVGGPPRSQAIDPPTDVDWFAFSAEAGRMYELVVHRTTESTQQLAVYGPQCGVEALEPSVGLREFVPQATGLYRLRVEASAYQPASGLYTVQVVDRGPATDLAGDTMAAAAAIMPDGSETLGAIEFWRDIDVFRVALSERTSYRIAVRAQGCGSPSAVIRRPGGAYSGLETWVWNMSLPGGECENYIDQPEVDLYVPGGDSGDHFIVVGGDPPSQYTVSVTPLRTWPASDDHADSCDAATPIAAGGDAVEGVIDPPGESDWFVFDAIAGHQYALHLFPGGAWGPRAIPAGPDCAPMPGNSFVSGVLVASASGQHRVRITGEDAGFGPNSGVYTLRVEDRGPVTDNHGDSAADATMLIPGDPPTPGQSDYHLDVDVFAFSAAERTLYTVELLTTACGQAFGRLQAPGEPWTRFLEAEGPAPDCPARPEARTTVYIPAGAEGIVPIEVWPWSDAPYSIQVTLVGSTSAGDDQPDACESAAPISIGAEPTAGFADSADDRDWFAFQAQAGHVYAIDVESPTETLANITAASAACEPFAAFSPYGTPRHLRAQTSGPMSFAVGLRSPGVYTVAVRDTGPAPDDHHFSPTRATRLPTNLIPLAGAADFPGDEDAFRFFMRPATAYRIRLEVPNLARMYTTVYNADAATRIASLYALGGSGPAGVQWDEAVVYAGAAEAGDRLILVRTDPTEAAVPYSLSITPIGCLADANNSGTVDASDVSAFLTAWLAAIALPHPADLAADFDGDTTTNSADISAFLTTWLASIAGGC